MAIPSDYLERVYAGVLGKIIGVYLGRPIEGWTYRQIVARFGQIDRYVHDDLGVPLVVTDDDITGTLTFIRALDDNIQAGINVSPEMIGQAWLNYIIENKTILWWGGMGLSTEHTAFLRLKNGIHAPVSGSIGLNGKVVAEQIGAQIFIDGWAMVSPNRPDRAADFARRAAAVSHDGEAIYAAQVIAAMEAAAFGESDLNLLLDIGVSFIPKDSTVYRMIDTLRNFRVKNGNWHDAMTGVLERDFGYDKFGGSCHVIPNHGVIILALLYGDDSFSKVMTIVNTCGWDTDCNSGNAGCFMGIKNALAGIDACEYDWRGPVADRLFLPTADGGSCMTDTVIEATKIAATGHRLEGVAYDLPKGGARFHFSLPGSVQGFAVKGNAAATLQNVAGRLAIHYRAGSTAVATATFMAPGLTMPGYALLATPTLSTGQRVRARVIADERNSDPVNVRLFASFSSLDGETLQHFGEAASLTAGGEQTLEWAAPSSSGQPYFEVGLAISAETPGSIDLDWMSWDGSARVTLGHIDREKDQNAKYASDAWRKQWVDSLSYFGDAFRQDKTLHAFTLVQNEGRGLAMYGTREWRDYSVRADVTPYMGKAVGLAARCQGLNRYYALLLTRSASGAVARLVKACGSETILAEIAFDWHGDGGSSYALQLSVQENKIQAWINDRAVMTASDSSLDCGGIALVMEEGRCAFGPVTVGD